MTKNKDLEKQFGNLIKSTRLEKGISQEKLAELSGLDRSYVSELERGEKTASIRTIFKLANGLSVEAYQLLKKIKINTPS